MSLATDTRELTQQIVDEFGAKFIAANIGCSSQAIYQWIEPDNGTQNLFLRIANFLDELKDQGPIGQRLMLTAARLMLSRTGMEPVEKVKKEFSISSLLEAMLHPNQEMADVQTVIIDALKDNQLTVEELKRARSEAQDVVKVALELSRIIDGYMGEAEANGGSVDMRDTDGNKLLSMKRV